MHVGTLLRAVRRHWPPVLLALILTGLVVSKVPDQITSEYVVRGNVILLSPSIVPGTAGEDVNVNPWSRFGTSESLAAAALAEVLRSDDKAEIIMSVDFVKDYGVAVNPGNGAIIDIEVVAESPASALAAHDLAMELLSDELSARQAAAGAEPDTWLRTAVLTKPDHATELPGSKIRAMIAVGFIGVVAAGCIALILDTLTTALRRRREALAADSTGDDDVDDLEPHGVRALRRNVGS